jgi:pyruvate dehydrogenase E1 component beta subunit
MYSDNCEIPEEEYYIPIGKAEVKREGTDCTIVSFSKMMKVTLSAADELAKDGVQCEVIDLRTIRPLDIDTIVNSVKKTNRLVIVEESWPFGSIASEITFQVQRHAFDYLDAPIKRVTGADSSMHYAPNLVEAYLPNPTKVIAAVRSAL